MTGEELKRLRKSLCLSISKSARQVEVSSRTWARWEAGNQRIPDGAVKLFLVLNEDARDALIASKRLGEPTVGGTELARRLRALLK